MQPPRLPCQPYALGIRRAHACRRGIGQLPREKRYVVRMLHARTAITGWGWRSDVDFNVILLRSRVLSPLLFLHMAQLQSRSQAIRLPGVQPAEQQAHEEHDRYTDTNPNDDGRRLVRVGTASGVCGDRSRRDANRCGWGARRSVLDDGRLCTNDSHAKSLRQGSRCVVASDFGQGCYDLVGNGGVRSCDPCNNEHARCRHVELNVRWRHSVQHGRKIAAERVCIKVLDRASDFHAHGDQAASLGCWRQQRGHRRWRRRRRRQRGQWWWW